MNVNPTQLSNNVSIRQPTENTEIDPATALFYERIKNLPKERLEDALGGRFPKELMRRNWIKSAEEKVF